MIRKLIFFTALLPACVVFGQQKEQLQKQNIELKQQITAINNDLAKTKSESKLSLAYLEAVNKKIELREKVYSNTQKEKKFIEDDIYLRQLEINRQNRELGVLRTNYAKVLVTAYKNKGVQNKVTFILSSRSLGEAIRRIQYLKMYSDYQDRKAEEIGTAAELLRRSLGEKQKSVNQKNIILANQQTELSTIEAEKMQKERLLQDFKKNESRLTAELQQKQAQSRQLEGQIRAIIAEELRIARANEEARKREEAEKIRLAKEAAAREKLRIEAENRARAEALERERKAAEAEAKKTAELAAKKAEDERRKAEEAAKAEASARDEARRVAAAKDAADAAVRAKAAAEKLEAAKAAEAELTRKKEAEKKAAETKALTNYGVTTVGATSFAANRGSMSMPAYGNITHRFGRQPHPVFPNIVEENNGIKIAVAKGTAAKCIFPGVVSQVLASGDGTRTVIVRHGEYFSIYSNLASTSVTKNQQIGAGTAVGVVGEDFDGSYTLDFQIWNGSTPVDPLSWIK